MLLSLGGTPTWRLHTGLCKFVQNISINIWSSGKRTDLKLGEVSYLFLPYTIIISWLYTLINKLTSVFLASACPVIDHEFRNGIVNAWQCNPRIEWNVSHDGQKIINKLWEHFQINPNWSRILPFSKKRAVSDFKSRVHTPNVPVMIQGLNAF